MAAERTCQFLLQVTAVDDDLGGPEAVEEFALALRGELADLQVTRVDQVPAGPAPEGTRAVEVIATFGLLLTAVQTVAALPAVVAAIRQFAAGYAQRRRPVRLTLAGVEIDPRSASDGELERVVQRLLDLPAQARAETRSALVVANERYADERLARLRSPSRDAQALARVLGDPAIGGFGVDLLVDADERTVRRRTAAFFADRDRDDVLLLHFSCHGVKDQRGRLYLAASDTDLSVLGATAVPASFVNDLLTDTQSRRVVLVLDCCYSGAFGRGGGQVRAGNEVHISDEFSAGTGRIVLTASSATEYAFEGGELTQSQASPSVFTGALVSGLQTGEADLDADGEISIDELYDYTYRTVRQSTPGQAPMKWSFGVEGNLVIARSVRPAALPSWINDDLVSDRVVLRLEAVRGLAEIVSGGKPGLRASAIGALSQLRDHDDSVRVRGAAAEALAAEHLGGVAAPPPRGDTVARSRGGPAAPPHRHSVAPPQAEPATRPRREPVAQPPGEPATWPGSETRGPRATEQQVIRPRPPGPAATGPVPQPPFAFQPWAARPQQPPPAPPAVDRDGGARRRLGPLVAAGASLVLASLLLYLIAALSDTVDWWTANPAWVVELVVVALLLGTRLRWWAGALAGLLAWELLYSAVLVFGDTRIDSDLLPLYVVANLLAVAALVCLTVSTVRARGTRRRPGKRRAAASTAVGLLALGAVLIAADVAWQETDLEDGGIGASIYVLVVCPLCALVLPLVGLGVAERRVAVFSAVGWLLGGLPFAIIGSSEMPGLEVSLLWLLLVSATAAAILVNRSGDDRPPPAAWGA